LNAGASRGFVVWLTGYPAAGKTTIGSLVAAELERRGCIVDALDGDEVRLTLSRGLGFSRQDREANVERVGWVASRLARAGVAVVVSLVSPYARGRARARALVEQHGSFFEVHIDTGLEECMRRDPKGLYHRAAQGKLRDLTGVSAPYERPARPDLRLQTEGRMPSECAGEIVQALLAAGLVTRRSFSAGRG
jgi:adenylyl-sulfate kinase